MTSTSPDRSFGCLLVVIVLLVAGYVVLYHPGVPVPWRAPAPTRTNTAVDPLTHRSARWADPAKAALAPGVQTITAGSGQCTADFVFTDAAGTVYLGQAAHCAETGAVEGKLRGGCKTRSLPLGTRVVYVAGASGDSPGKQLATGRLAYSSWLTMQAQRVRNPVLCAYNDFALVRIDGHPAINPSMPFWGGPTGLYDGAGFLGAERVYGIGRSSLRKAGSPYSRQTGIAMTDQPEAQGWSHTFYARSPGIPGDSGSGYLDVDGHAVGTLSTLLFGNVLLNTLGDLRRELGYARLHSGIRGLRLELGTVPFRKERAAEAK